MLALSVPIERVNYLAGHKSMAMIKRYDHANEERYWGLSSRWMRRIKPVVRRR